jgi:hypothetical protein
MSLPEVATLVAAMVQARDAVAVRSWSHRQEPSTDAWWADVLADPRARKRERRTDLAVKQAFYRLADETRETILVACSKCDWRATLTISLRRVAASSAPIGIGAACITSSRSRARGSFFEMEQGRACGALVGQIHRCKQQAEDELAAGSIASERSHQRERDPAQPLNYAVYSSTRRSEVRFGAKSENFCSF